MKKDRYNVEDTMNELPAVSSNDCTGLIPGDPDADELENYEEIYPLLLE